MSLAHSILQSQAVAIQVDLNRAMRIQHGLLPQRLPFEDRISCATMYHPMAKVGGDLYDFFQLDDHRFGLYIADASGHGVSSAMLTVFLKHAMQSAVRTEETGAVRAPGDVLCRLNQIIISEAFGQGVFVSMIYLVLDVNTGLAIYSDAGHPPALVRCADGGQDRFCAIERWHRPAPVLGVNPAVRYSDGECTFSRGDLLVLYTDGITEARDPEGAFFGEERLRRIVAESGPHADQVSDVVQRALAAFQEGCPRTDDATLVVLAFEPQLTAFHVPEEEPTKTPAVAHRSVKVLTAKHDHRVFISIMGPGSWRESQQVLDLCEQARARGERSVILDLSHCTHLDSTFLGVLHNIAAGFDRDPEPEGAPCRFDIQNLPEALLREMSGLGLTAVLAHFRPEPVPVPESMDPVEGGIPAGEEMGRLLLWAHEALVEADPSNADRFAAVLQVLSDRAKGANRGGEPPRTSEE